MSREGWMKKKAGRDGDNGWSERGGYMAAKVSKLDEQFNLDAPREIQKGGASSCLFRGVAIYVNGYTDPSADELRRLMMVHGGQFHVYYSRSKTTHIIANNLPNSKIQELRQEKVVSPKWITDSIKAGRLLPHLQYQLYAKQRAGLFSAVTSDVAQRGPDSAHSHQSHALVRPRDAPLSHEPAESHPPFSHSQGRTDTARPQSRAPCRANGSLHARTDATRHSETDETRMCSAADPLHQVGSAALTTGNAGPVNGALKESGHGPHDPYEFPHSPPGPLAPPPGSPEASEPPPCTADPNEEQTPAPVAAASHCLPPLRVNGGHLKAFSLDGGGGGGGAKPQPPPDKRLLAQTGGLISEYYAHSRLHQISTWRTGFSEYVNELHSKRTASGGATFPGRERLRRAVTQRPLQGGGASVTSCVMHVDMDCFFVSVGIRHRPELRGKPVAVTSSHGTGRVPLRPGADPQLEQQLYLRKQGAAPPTSDPLTHTGSWQSPGPEQDSCLSMAEIASCSYEARRAGVRNGMFFGKAKQLCPTLQSVPYDFQAYKEVALSMYEVLASYTHDIEALSCDEVLVDASALLADLAIGPEDLARAIRADIREKTGCCASIGMGSNILLARLSTRRAKPDGQFLLKSEDVDDFIRYLPVSSLPGVGPVMGRKLAALGVRSCGDLQQVSLSQLQKKFGPRTGQTLFRFCRGLDERPVRYEKERKSVSAEMNYNIRFTKVDEAECFLSNLSMEVQRRLQDAGLQGRRVTLKVMVRKEGAPQEPSKYGGHGICDNLARTVLLAQSTDSGQLIAAAVIKLFHAMKLQVEDLRGLGIQVQLLEGSQPKSRSIKDLLLSSKEAVDSSTSVVSSGPAPPTQLVPGTSGKQEASCQPPSPAHSRLNVSIEIPPPSQVDRSVLQALPPSLRQQVEQSWTSREPPSPAPPPAAPPPAGPLVLQIPNHPNSPGLVLELPGLSQVDPDVFAALPKELQDELRSAYGSSTNAAPHSRAAEPRNPLLQLKQAVSAGRVKRRYKRKNMASPMKKNPSPQKKAPPPLRSEVKTETAVASLENQDLLAPQRSKFKLRPPPALAGACDLPDIKTLLREWVTTITDPMEEDILQVVKFCTDLIEHRDLEKLDLIIKYMKRLMQHSVESVWSMAFDFILDNVQVVVQQMYGSTLKVT